MQFVHSAASLSVLLLSAAGAAWPLGSKEPSQEGPPAARADTALELQERMSQAATDFLGRLDAARKKEASASWDEPERRTWAFGPVQREGLALGSLSQEEFAALEALLGTALSPTGMAAWGEVRALENVLRELESTPEKVATHRDPDLYWLRVYGTPGTEERWSWRFEGHHLALHVSCLPGQYPTVTPFFLGANPLFTEALSAETKEIRMGLFQGLNGSLKDLLRSLDEEESMSAMGRGAGRPGDVRMGPGTSALPEAHGTHWSQLSEGAQTKLNALFNRYMACLNPELRRFELGAGGTEEVRFARWGGTGIDEARTWAIVTPTFALELATTDGPHHVHIVLRDVERDFGGE